MIKSKVVKINDDSYEVLYILPPGSQKSQAENAVLRYSSQQSPAILMESTAGQWFITRKIKDVIFTDIDKSELIDDNITSQAVGGLDNGINNKEED